MPIGVLATPDPGHDKWPLSATAPGCRQGPLKEQVCRYGKQHERRTVPKACEFVPDSALPPMSPTRADDVVRSPHGGVQRKSEEGNVTENVDALIRNALRDHAQALYEAGDPSLSPWPDDPDGSLLRFSEAIRTVLDACREWEDRPPVNPTLIPGGLRMRLAFSLGLIEK